MNLYCGAQSYQHPAKQNKIASQRQYRVKEGDGFQELKDVIRLVTGETPQTRCETLKKAAELLRDLSREHGEISRHEPLPPLKYSSTSAYETDQGSRTAYGTRFQLVDDRISEIPRTSCNSQQRDVDKRHCIKGKNSSPMSDTSVMSSILEYEGHPQTEIHHIVGGEGNWNLVQPTPSQFRHNSFPGQWNDMSLIHSNVDRVPYYLERVVN
ncbi:uncharacterized protein F5147DRAFT_659551 [Suillus discolor]|uniref:BHLH domain-containing protein n=1 Tax=Suillus discolor TaxID=1912936 RepID=A0A9P7JLE4_9AGAM|nr:uncharacterized protein F5147DRAFT_659551 [Suillus discolor]KAG2085286.1 hypothetical protein F5147DRAFT_659551 [Suillus discolor]